MAFEVVAQSAADFDAWRTSQGQVAVAANSNEVATGQHLFADRCAGCHMIRGTDAAGLQAPDLTHLDSRRTIAAGALTNTPAHLLDWIEHAQQVKSGTLMHDIVLTAADATACRPIWRPCIDVPPNHGAQADARSSRDLTPGI